MLCLYPITATKILKGSKFDYQFACGQCMPCRITKAQKWKLRLILEAKTHEQSVFTTLTVAPNGAHTKDIQFPDDNQDAHSPTHSVEKKQLQKFIKRLRKNTGIKFRYYACGEYGSNTKREHYHLVLFGYPIELEQEIANAWHYGTTQTDEFTPERAGYISGYVTKKLKSAESENTGREPEFALMSRGRKKGDGLGGRYCFTVADSLKKHNIQFDPENLNVLRYKGSILPLDNYMKEHIHQQYYGMSEYERATLTMSPDEAAQWELGQEMTKTFNKDLTLRNRMRNHEQTEEKQNLSARKSRQYHASKRSREPR